MTWRRHKWVFSGAGVLALALTLFFAFRNDEPVYEGRTLSSWMEDLPPPMAIPGTPFGFDVSVGRWYPTEKEKTSAKAIRAIGTNALPHLVASLKRNDSKLVVMLQRWVNKNHVLKIQLITAAQRQAQATSALQELGPTAIPAWSEILLDEKLDIHKRSFAAVWLGNLRVPLSGPTTAVSSNAQFTMQSFVRSYHEAAWRALLKGFSSPNPVIRSNTAYNLAGFGTKASNAIPTLLKYVEDPDAGVRSACNLALSKCEPDSALALIRALKYETGRRRAGLAASLALLKQRPEQSIEALIGVTNDPEPFVRETAISALADFGSQASNAIPALLLACTDTNKFVRRAATNALSAISSGKDGG